MTKKEVVKKTEGGLPADLMASMEADAAVHKQEFRRDMLIIPRINILQDLSPEIKERRAEYVPGAKVGDIYCNINNGLSPAIRFIPSRFDVRYIAWKTNRGGLVDQNLTKEDAETNFEPDGLGKWTGSMKDMRGEMCTVEVIETPEWVGIAYGIDNEGERLWGPMPVAISFPITKSKAARKINTSIDLAVEPGTNGGKDFRPPCFYHQFTLKSAIEQAGENEWFGWTVTHDGYIKDASDLERAKELKIAFDEGTVEVSTEGSQ